MHCWLQGKPVEHSSMSTHVLPSSFSWNPGQHLHWGKKNKDMKTGIHSYHHHYLLLLNSLLRRPKQETHLRIYNGKSVNFQERFHELCKVKCINLFSQVPSFYLLTLARLQTCLEIIKVTWLNNSHVKCKQVFDAFFPLSSI